MTTPHRDDRRKKAQAMVRYLLGDGLLYNEIGDMVGEQEQTVRLWEKGTAPDPERYAKLERLTTGRRKLDR